MQIPLAFLVGAPGGGELLLIFVVILLMFGPKKLPEVARNIGKAMEYLRRTSQDFREQVMRMDEEPPKMVEEALKDSVEPASQSGQTELPLGISDSSQPSDPYQLYEDSSMASSTPGSEKKVSETAEIQPKEENAAKTESIPASSPEDISGSKDPDAGQKDGLAG